MINVSGKHYQLGKSFLWLDKEDGAVEVTN